MQIHNIEPVYDSNSEILVLGSFPSVKSREAGFFYAHPQNRFWKVCAAVYGCEVPGDIPAKKRFLLENHIALWDVIASCEIKGSSDASITDAVPNDIPRILSAARIRAIFCNGSTSYKLYNRFMLPVTGMPAVQLPSTSPANAAFTLERLISAYGALTKRDDSI